MSFGIGVIVITNKKKEENMLTNSSIHKEYIGNAKCPKCGNISRYDPYSKIFNCHNCGVFKDDSSKTMWLENLNK